MAPVKGKGKGKGKGKDEGLRKNTRSRAIRRKRDREVHVAAKEGDASGLRMTTCSSVKKGRPGLPSTEPHPPPVRHERDNVMRSPCYQSATPVKEHQVSCEEDEEGKTPTKMDAGDEELSSAPSSPLCQPYLPDDQELDFDIIGLYKQKSKEYHKKRARQLRFPTLNTDISSSCLLDPNLLDIREAATKTILTAAKFVLSLSSFIDGNPLARCSGFLIDWDETTKHGVVVTTADIICSKSSLDHWSGEHEYSYGAKVFVHLLDDTTVEGHLIYSQTHYNLAFFEIIVESPIQIPNFTLELKYAQQIFVLGRDENLCLSISHDKVQYCNPCLCDRHHYMYVDSATPECSLGGIVIDLEGKVVGMTCHTHAFIPSSILLKCLRLWQMFRCIPRPQLGLKLSGIKFLDIPHIEMISRKMHICDGLIVEEVASGSTIEKLGVRVGDIIEHLNGECISDTIQWEEMLLRVCEEHFNKADGLNSKLDIKVGLFQVRKGARRMIKLTTDVSEHGEVVKRGTFPVIIPTREEMSTRAPFEEATAVK